MKGMEENGKDISTCNRCDRGIRRYKTEELKYRAAMARRKRGCNGFGGFARGVETPEMRWNDGEDHRFQKCRK